MASELTEDELARWEALYWRWLEAPNDDDDEALVELTAALPRLTAAVRQRDAQIAELEAKLEKVREELEHDV